MKKNRSDYIYYILTIILVIAFLINFQKNNQVVKNNVANKDEKEIRINLWPDFENTGNSEEFVNSIEYIYENFQNVNYNIMESKSKESFENLKISEKIITYISDNICVDLSSECSSEQQIKFSNNEEESCDNFICIIKENKDVIESIQYNSENKIEYIRSRGKINYQTYQKSQFITLYFSYDIENKKYTLKKVEENDLQLNYCGEKPSKAIQKKIVKT